jgi:Rrf2 family protein
MLLPQTAEYALRAIIHIAACHERAPGGLVRVNDIATTLGVPKNYLAKTLNQLARAGVLASTRGPTGGFRLAIPAARLTLERVTRVFTAKHARRCLLGTGPCGENPGCPVHERWKPVAARVSDYFANTTIADVTSAGSTPSTAVGPGAGLDVPRRSTVGAGAEGTRDDVTHSPSPPRGARQEIHVL